MATSESRRDAARQLAVRLSEHLARSGHAGVVEPVDGAIEDGTIELRWTPPDGPPAGEMTFRWVVDATHLETQYLDLVRRIDLIFAAPPGAHRPATSAAAPGWCQWE